MKPSTEKWIKFSPFTVLWGMERVYLMTEPRPWRYVACNYFKIVKNNLFMALNDLIISIYYIKLTTWPNL